jgi:1,4-alpha-glucan branching enzyme
MKRCLIFAWILAAVALNVRADDDIATTFTYADANATTVEVAGEFTGWKTVPLAKDASGNWTKTLYLKPGQYGYKIVVNGDWKFDPKNPARKVVNDIENSAVTVGNAPAPAATGDNAVTFTFTDAKAKSVHVAGEFNRWLDNVDGKVSGNNDWQMQNDGAGNWKLSKTLPPGRYKFKYVVDGGDHWSQDPNLPGSPDGNSIIEVKGAATATPVTGGTAFTYADPKAKAVFVAGQFNNWNGTANPMKKDDAGIWSATIPLKPGKQPYKFVVDGDWRPDPTNPDSADDGSGNMNSIKTVAP